MAPTNPFIADSEDSLADASLIAAEDEIVRPAPSIRPYTVGTDGDLEPLNASDARPGHERQRSRHVRVADTFRDDADRDSSSLNDDPFDPDRLQRELMRDPSRVKHRRWGTQRNPQGRRKGQNPAKGLGRQLSTLLPASRSASKSGTWSQPGSRGHATKRESTPADESSSSDDIGTEKQPFLESRKIYFGQSLPSDLLDESGVPVQYFGRNKIRTTKYTPLSFVPKNIAFQFKNIANIYFLFIVILGAFPIFGVQSPGLAAVPIVVIVVITAIKDAIEDYRRTLMDLEVNNGLTERLVGYENPNVMEENVSMWRRFKKANSRFAMKIARWIERKKADRIERKTGVRPQPKFAFGQELTDIASVYSRDSFEIADLGTTAGDPESIVVPSKHAFDAKFRPDFWKNVKVGDFVRVRSDQEIPADVAILATSEEDGACYIETKNLDGETNLKVRQALKCGQQIKRGSDCARTEFMIDSEAPMPNLYTYSGVIKWETTEGSRSEPITINNLLLRGCKLRNTSWAIGVVLYTGMDTKIMLNAGVTPTKRSYLQKNLNMLVIYNFALLFIICFVSAVINGVARRSTNSTFRWFERGSPGGSPPVDGIVTFWAVLILYQSLVPISLYISIEIIKTAQAFFIYSDCYMYYEPIDYPCTPKTWNISDDLGQIEYVFSDKTGTLTQNVMEFKKCTINGVAYGKAYTEALAGLRKRAGVDVDVEAREMEADIAEDRIKMLKQLRSISQNKQIVEEEVTFVSADFVADLQGRHGAAQATANNHFMLCLALCNSVLTEKSKKHKGRVEFKAQSPDEAALVGTARDMGFALVARIRRGVVLNIQGREVEFQVLNTLEFNSTRKRMSAIVKMDNRILLICKGADSVIYERLTRESSPDQQALREKTAVHLEEFANEGLRTLCVAERELTLEAYTEWNIQHEKAAAEIHDREAKLDAVAELIEREMTLIGGTAIEDRLQDGVPRTISLLGDGGIKLWVLTGDKIETAINIGFSCNLLNNDMELLVVRIEDGDRGSVPAQIDEFLHKHFGMDGSWEELEAAKLDHSPPNSRFAVVIDGDALKLALNPAIQHKFLLLCKQCRSVLCCRVSPAQKAEVVRLVRKTLDVMTLAIGDGANDVAMIQEAHVGVGIAGEEGRQAVMSSDYAVGQFRFLGRLLLVHGRYSYRRLAEMVPNFFYKNVLFTMTLFWYGICNEFDGSYLFEYTYVMFFNLAFTSLPVIIMGILDQDVPDRISLAVPQLYRRGITRDDFTISKFWLYMVEGFYQSFVCFFFPYFCYFMGRFEDESGHPVHHRFWMGLAVCTLAVMSANFYVVTNQYRWDWLSMLINVVSSVAVFFWSGVYSTSYFAGELYGVASEMYGTLIFWAVVLLGSVTCMLFHFTFMTVRAFLMPQDVDIIREQWKLGEFDTVMATPLAADDPDAAQYENPYRVDTYRRQPFFGRRAGKHTPYELSPDSHADLAQSPDFVRVGGRRVASEQFLWDTPIGLQARRDVDLDPKTRKSLDHARMHSRWEQEPVFDGIENVAASGDLSEDITTAEGLMQHSKLHRRSLDEDDRR